MKKSLKIVLILILFAVMILPHTSVNATETITVKSQEEFEAALGNSTYTTIIIGESFTTDKKINITRDVTIDGNNKTITMQMEDNTIWNTNQAYVLQAYRVNTTIKNLSLTGANAALLVNGANVTLEGNINVSGNGFGGIELATNGGVVPKITFNNAKLTNDSEKYLKPTLWTAPINDENITINYGFAYDIKVEKSSGDVQRQYYLNKSNVPADEQAQEGIDKGKVEIEASSTDKITAETLNNLKNGPAKDVIIKTENATISFNTSNISEDFSGDLSLKIDITKEQPFDSNVLQDSTANLLFIDLAYSGILAKDTKITFSVADQYKAGDKVFLYYYNSGTDKLELVSEDITIDESGMATITIDHASTYLLSSTKIGENTNVVDENIINQVETAEENIENPNTSDITIFIVAMLVIIGIAGIAYAVRVNKTDK